jgi:hypothetical protein
MTLLARIKAALIKHITIRITMKELIVEYAQGPRHKIPVTNNTLLFFNDDGLPELIKPDDPRLGSEDPEVVEYSALTAKWNTTTGGNNHATLLRTIDGQGRLNYQATADGTSDLLQVYYSPTGVYGAGWYVYWKLSIVAFSSQGTANLPPLNQADYQTKKSGFVFTTPITAHRLA